MPLTLKELMDDLPATGQVEWIGVRPARKQAMESVEAVQARCGTGLVGDRYTGKSGKRDVTLIQHEHLAAIAGFLGQKIVTPESLRRNIVVRGVNLLALKGRLFRTGDVVLEFTGLCHPCSAMQARAFAIRAPIPQASATANGPSRRIISFKSSPSIHSVTRISSPSTRRASYAETMLG